LVWNKTSLGVNNNHSMADTQNRATADRQRVARPQRGAWCFTINNPSTTWNSPADFMADVHGHPTHKVRYLVFQLEKGDNGTLHWQGYVEFMRSVRFGIVQVLMKGKAHLEPRRGTRSQARMYCMKTDSREDGPWEVGDWRSGGQGTRNDLVAVADEIERGATEATIASHFPVCYIKYHSGLNKLICLNVKERTEPPTVILCYGPTGTGKTKYCYDTWPELYRKPCESRWFDKYQSQQVLLIDDFGGRASKMSLLYLLQLLDRYPIIVEAKGRYISMQATTIVITTNSHPRLWYDYSRREESYRALARRVHLVYYFKKFGDSHLCISNSSFFSDWSEYCDEDTVFTQVTRPNTPVNSDSEEETTIEMSISSSESENLMSGSREDSSDSSDSSTESADDSVTDDEW